MVHGERPCTFIHACNCSFVRLGDWRHVHGEWRMYLHIYECTRSRHVHSCMNVSSLGRLIKCKCYVYKCYMYVNVIYVNFIYVNVICVNVMYVNVIHVNVIYINLIYVTIHLLNY